MITNEEYVDYLRYNWGISEKSANENNAILIIKLKNHYSFTSDKYVLYSLLSNAIKEYQQYSNNAKKYIFLERISGFLQHHCKLLLDYTINKQKESEMKEKEFVLTEDVSLYQFRDMPNAEILEIEVPKDERFWKQVNSCRVWFKTKSGALEYILTNIGGNYFSDGSRESNKDIILKPKKRPFTHEEILGLIWDGAIFREEIWGKSDFSFITACLRGQYLLGSAYYIYEALVKEFFYSLDDGKTWHKLEKEV